MAGQDAVSTVIVDVNESTFQREVIDRSRQVPVVVDFWAAWCGPCKSLGPILEELAQDYRGRFILARLDVDANQRLAAQFGIQGIPAVKAFKGGQVADEFVGALPRPIVRQFIEKIVPNEHEGRLREGQALLAAGRSLEAETIFREILAVAPDQAAAALGLAQAQLAQSDEEGAAQTLDQFQPGGPVEAIARQLRAELDLRREVKGLVEPDLRNRLAGDSADLAARYDLARLLTVQHRYEEALAEFLEIVRRDRGYHNDGVRTSMLYIFDILGDVPLARNYRNRLASILFA